MLSGSQIFQPSYISWGRPERCTLNISMSVEEATCNNATGIIETMYFFCSHLVVSADHQLPPAVVGEHVRLHGYAHVGGRAVPLHPGQRRRLVIQKFLWMKQYSLEYLCWWRFKFFPHFYLRGVCKKIVVSSYATGEGPVPPNPNRENNEYYRGYIQWDSDVWHAFACRNTTDASLLSTLEIKQLYRL